MAGSSDYGGNVKETPGKGGNRDEYIVQNNQCGCSRGKAWVSFGRVLFADGNITGDVSLSVCMRQKITLLPKGIYTRYCPSNTHHHTMSP